jgi:hypothetical protein
MVVLNSKPLQFKILKFIHDSPIIGYPSYAKTYKIVQRVYYWPIIYNYIYLQKDFLYKEIRSTLTIANFNIKMA